MRAWLVVVVAACGNSAESPPDSISAGPVSIDTATLTITVTANTPMVLDHFIQVGDVDSIDENHYYDPTAGGVDLEPPDHATAVDGDWVVLDDGTEIRLQPCAIANCAVLDVDASRHTNAVLMQVALPKGVEPLYGTGDAPITPNVAGTVREMELRIDLDSASSLNETHVAVPLVMWPRTGAGMFVADDRAGAIDLGVASPNLVTATFTQPIHGSYRVFIYTASDPLDLVRDYVALSAKPAIPPRWAFAPQQWRNEWTDGTQMVGDATEMRTLHIPGSVMWIDNPWETGYNTFDVDDTRFPQVQQMIAGLNAQGYRVVFWSTPYVDSMGLTAADHAEGASLHHFVTDNNDVVLDYPWANGPGALVDFTHDGAIAWWQQRIAKTVGVGASGFKLDYGEDLIPDLGGSIVPMVLAAGDNQLLHGRYSAGYHTAYLGALPPGDGFLITRAGAWGEQATNTAIWPGDLEGDFSVHGVVVDGKKGVGGLPSAISRGLSLSLSGYPFYGSDIGGFRGFPTTEVLLRWAEYAAFGTIMQLGGGGTSHDPWDTTLFDATAADIYKTYATLHMQLNPLLWTLAQKAARDGTPVTRPARFVFDCQCDDMMFLLGDDILVAPVITSGATTREVVLPPGTWVDRSTGAPAVGDGTTAITVPAPLDTIPTWYRSGSMIPMYAIAADTILPATAPGVTSYAGPNGSELRLTYTPGDTAATTTLDDGASASGTGPDMTWAAGSEYQVATFDIDGRSLTGALAAPTAVSGDGVDLANVADVTTCAAPGCWSFDAPTKHLLIRTTAAGISVR
jgi:alpha-glucosidase (family GH31 glycosyl hydrolase)